MNIVAHFCLAKVQDVSFHGVIAMAGCDIVETGANEAQHFVGNFAEDL